MLRIETPSARFPSNPWVREPTIVLLTGVCCWSDHIVDANKEKTAEAIIKMKTIFKTKTNELELISEVKQCYS